MSKLTTGTIEPGIGEEGTIKVAGDLRVNDDVQVLGNQEVVGNDLVKGNQKVEGNISIDGTMEQADLPMFACRAWVNFDGTTTPPTIRASGNVASVTRPGTGHYVITFLSPMPDANYATSIEARMVASGNPNDVWIRGLFVDRVEVGVGSGSNNALFDHNSNIVTVVVFR